MSFLESCASDLSTRHFTDNQLLLCAKSYNCLRILNKAAEAFAGTSLLMEMCKGCVENRNEACDNCKALHEQLDHIEVSVSNPLFFSEDDDGKEGFKYQRTLAFRNEFLEKESRRCYGCGFLMPSKE